METGNRKFHNFIWSLVLCISIVAGALSPAYASSNTGIYDQAIYNNTNTLVTDVANIWSLINNLTNVLNGYIATAQSFFNAWGQPTYLPNSLLSQLHNDIVTFNNNYVSTSADFSRLNDIYNSVVAINADTYTIDNNVDNIYTWVMAIGQAIAGIQTDVSSIASDTSNLPDIKTNTDYLPGIKSNTDYLPGIKTDTASINTNLQSFKDDFNNINWISYNGYVGLKTETNGNYITSATSNTDWYLYFYPTSNINVYKIHVPLIVYATRPYDLNIDFKFLNPNGTVYDVSDFIISYDFGNTGCDLILNIPLETYYISSPSIIYFKSNYALRYNAASGNTFYIDNNSSDYFELSNFNVFRNLYIYFKQAKEVFFDDKTIQAKKNNQAQEDTVLDNFTGSGSASATVSDFGAVKDSIVDLKGGFSGGASSAETFTFLSGDSNAWDWFTQETADSLDNTQGNNNRLMRGCGSMASDTPLLDSYYNDIMSILGVN